MKPASTISMQTLSSVSTTPTVVLSILSSVLGGYYRSPKMPGLAGYLGMGVSGPS
jgi:hypothetical protein